ncbi:hypothetical protein [Selenomonas ruminantium]|uniref:hypothetical protein n=1 Tax=Selenomonas ruminantium TaxID=971 RepID=UPI001C40A065|nr:hypothetical protein [Selenomonas ruminantium]
MPPVILPCSSPLEGKILPPQCQKLAHAGAGDELREDNPPPTVVDLTLVVH